MRRLKNITMVANDHQIHVEFVEKRYDVFGFECCAQCRSACEKLEEQREKRDSEHSIQYLQSKFTNLGIRHLDFEFH